MKILVVDDELDVQTLFQQKFRKEIREGEFDFAFATSGEAALAYMTNHHQEAVLILSDINMPGMSGLQLLAKIKKEYATPPPVVMMITAYGDAENQRQATALGADDFLTKPVDFISLKEKLKTHYRMTKILVADDEADLETLIRQKFRQKIRENEYEFVFAANGKEALKKMEDNPDVSVVLSDINMPEMDGLTLLSKICENTPLIKTVMVSAYGDMDNIRTAMNRGAFDFVTKPVNFEDLEITVAKTIKHVLQLKQTLQAIKENNILKMYVDENVLNFMGTKEYEESLMANESIEASVAFVDICGFTAISEKEKPDTVVRMLNTYFDLMVKEILAQGGVIDKFIGDCVMAVFKGNYHLDRAIDASLAIRKNIAALPAEHSFVPQVSIGIRSGEMVSGNIGSATLKRLDFTVIGDTVNTAQRIQSAAGKNQIAIASDDYEKVKLAFECKEIGAYSLKNKEAAVKLYEVIQ